MTNEDLALKLQETTDRSLRNEGRIKKLEGEHEALHELAKSVALMAQKLESMNERIGEVAEDVRSLELEPGERWKTMVKAIGSVIISALVGFALARVGLK